MVLEFASTIKTAIKVEQLHIIVPVKFKIRFLLFKEIVSVEIQDRIDSINICQTSPCFAISMYSLHFLIQILEQRAFIINLLIILRIFGF